ncbi:unnamed protein product [Schistosoma mattheei]|uniref:Uncharacterized protein n=1 Tax=Schistosoma mattheei TaxID=31246 RepID=A0A3P8K5C3_9TREM|nr:unnamed protein product [Schistosoma mattheei]
MPGVIPYKNNEQLSSDNDLIHVIPCLRVDGPLDFNRADRIGSVNALNNLGLLIDQNIPGLLLDFSISHKNQHNRVRAQSPKVTDSSKESRRKRGDENELRTADDTKILQVIEAYCASSWTHPSYRTSNVNRKISTKKRKFRSPKDLIPLLVSNNEYSVQYPSVRGRINTTNFPCSYKHLILTAIDQSLIGICTSCADCLDIAWSHKLYKQRSIVANSEIEEAPFVVFGTRQLDVPASQS